jgi:predicted outer membrane protein
MTFLPPRALLLLAIAAVPLRASAQTDGALPTTQSVYSLYVARHEATVRFAELGKARASSKDVRKVAELLAKENRKTGERIAKLAAKEGVTLSRPAHDTTDVLLAHATRQLEGKSGAQFDSLFAMQAHDWLMTLAMDNGKTVLRPLPAGPLKRFGEAYGMFLFREMGETLKLKKKYEKE